MIGTPIRLFRLALNAARGEVTREVCRANSKPARVSSSYAFPFPDLRSDGLLQFRSEHRLCRTGSRPTSPPQTGGPVEEQARLGMVTFGEETNKLVLSASSSLSNNPASAAFQNFVRQSSTRILGSARRTGNEYLATRILVSCRTFDRTVSDI